MISQTAATDGASFLYPALTDTEQQDTHGLVETYRRAMGRTRILAVVAAGALLSWGVWHSKRGAHAPAKKRRRRRRFAHA